MTSQESMMYDEKACVPMFVVNSKTASGMAKSRRSQSSLVHEVLYVYFHVAPRTILLTSVASEKPAELSTNPPFVLKCSLNNFPQEWKSSEGNLPSSTEGRLKSLPTSLPEKVGGVALAGDREV